MKIIYLLIALISFKSFPTVHSNLKPFLTDFCTAYPEGTIQKPDAWKHCCLEHDLYFWAGGSQDDRKQTDMRLKNCVENAGFPTQAKLIYAAVSLGGSSPIRFRTKEWGHAWSGRQRYISLSEDETSLLLQFLETQTATEIPSSLKQAFKEQLHSRLDTK